MRYRIRLCVLLTLLLAGIGRAERDVAVVELAAEHLLNTYSYHAFFEGGAGPLKIMWLRAPPDNERDFIENRLRIRLGRFPHNVRRDQKGIFCSNPADIGSWILSSVDGKVPWAEKKLDFEALMAAMKHQIKNPKKRVPDSIDSFMHKRPNKSE